MLVKTISTKNHINTLFPPMQIYFHEDSNWHSGTLVFLLGHYLANIPFVFLVSISWSLIFYFILGLRNEFGSLCTYNHHLYVPIGERSTCDDSCIHMVRDLQVYPNPHLHICKFPSCYSFRWAQIMK